MALTIRPMNCKRTKERVWGVFASSTTSPMLCSWPEFTRTASLRRKRRHRPVEGSIPATRCANSSITSSGTVGITPPNPSCNPMSRAEQGPFRGFRIVTKEDIAWKQRSVGVPKPVLRTFHSGKENLEAFTSKFLSGLVFRAGFCPQNVPTSSPHYTLPAFPFEKKATNLLGSISFSLSLDGIESSFPRYATKIRSNCSVSKEARSRDRHFPETFGQPCYLAQKPRSLRFQSL